MIYAEILAGGKGSRMGNVPLPKQFLDLGGKPIIVQTVEKFLLQPRFKAIIIVVLPDWVHYTEDLLNSNINQSDLDCVFVTEGGSERNDTLFMGIDFIQKKFGVNKDDVVITHDAVRPFVSQRIIDENINGVLKVGAIDTVIPAIDTIIQANEHNNTIDLIPDRKLMYQGQTPQSFNIQLLKESYKKLTDKERNVLTDAAKIVLLSSKKKVGTVIGDQQNFKITTSFDYKMAESIVSEGDN